MCPQRVHMLHHKFDPQFLSRHTEFPVTSGHQTARTPNHPGQGENVMTCMLDTSSTSHHLNLHCGIPSAALSSDLSKVVSNHRFINCLVFDRQAALRRHLRQRSWKTEEIRSVQQNDTPSSKVAIEVYFFTESLCAHIATTWPVRLPCGAITLLKLLHFWWIWVSLSNEVQSKNTCFISVDFAVVHKKVLF